MQKIMFFDTETTGLISNWDAPLTHESNPVPIQYAILLTDESGNVYSSLYLLNKNAGKIPKEATAIHGITEDQCKLHGVTSLAFYRLFAMMAENVDLIVGHNIKFDLRIMEILGARLKLTKEKWFLTRKTFCTMETFTDICKIPSPYKQGQFKWPKLEEAYRFCFDKDFETHDALSDVEAVKEIYFHWKENLA